MDKYRRGFILSGIGALATVAYLYAFDPIEVTLGVLETRDVTSYIHEALYQATSIFGIKRVVLSLDGKKIEEQNKLSFPFLDTKLNGARTLDTKKIPGVIHSVNFAAEDNVGRSVETSGYLEIRKIDQYKASV